MIATWLYTIRDGASVRVPWQDVVRTQYGAEIDWQHAEPYDEPPLRAQYKPARQVYGKHAAMIAEIAKDDRIASKAWRTELLYEIERRYDVNRKVAGYLLRQARKRKGEKC